MIMSLIVVTVKPLSEGVEVDISGLGPSQPKKARKEKRPTAKRSGRFRKGWNLPRFIAASTKGDKFAYCQLCSKNFMVSHSGFSDIRCHCEGLQHTERYKESPKNANITSLLSSSLTSKVMSAEVMMAVWIKIQITDPGEVKYKHLSTLALQLLTSNTDSIFSLVRRIPVINVYYNSIITYWLPLQ